MRLGGKVAIVTGGARHIGAAYCRRLAAEGAAVLIADVLGGDGVVKEIAAAGGKAIALKVDVSREEDTERIAVEAVQAFGRIDILVNNAAIFLNIQRHPFYEISAEEWDRVSAVNIKGPFLCAKAVFPQMKQQCNGKIINISS
ncbi:MAG TPA: SDR family NAD(P)-dependent oxidoreductase, partial [Candidatus Binatia bacterium]|nr:SDR family NAD(P)-dependent oxidoreductase [Candidatus Binatia bacterium]